MSKLLRNLQAEQDAQELLRKPLPMQWQVWPECSHCDCDTRDAPPRKFAGLVTAQAHAKSESLYGKHVTVLALGDRVRALYMDGREYRLEE